MVENQIMEEMLHMLDNMVVIINQQRKMVHQ
jgi:hypothetical protein